MRGTKALHVGTPLQLAGPLIRTINSAIQSILYGIFLVSQYDSFVRNAMLPDVLLQCALSFANDRGLVNFARSSRKHLSWCQKNTSLRETRNSQEAPSLVRAGWKVEGLLISDDKDWARLRQVWTQNTRQGLRRLTFLKACNSDLDAVFDCTNLEFLDVHWCPNANLEFLDGPKADHVDFTALRNLVRAGFRTSLWDSDEIQRMSFGDALQVLEVDPGYKGSLAFIQARGLTKLDIRGRLPPDWRNIHMPKLEQLNYADAVQNLTELLQPLALTRLSRLEVSGFSALRMDLGALSSFDSSLRILALSCKGGCRTRIDCDQLFVLPRTLEILFLCVFLKDSPEIDLDVIGQRCPNLKHVDISLFSDGWSAVHLDITTWSECANLAAATIKYLRGPLVLPDNPQCIWPSLKFVEICTEEVTHKWQAKSQGWHIR